MKARNYLLMLSVMLAVHGSTTYVRECLAEGQIDITKAGPVTGTYSIVWDSLTTYTFIDDITTDFGIVVWRGGITINGDGYTLRGVGTASGAGFYLEEDDGVTIRNLTIENFQYGIVMGHESKGDENTIINNIIQGNNIGIDMSESDNNLITQNTIRDNLTFGVSTTNSCDGNEIYFNNFIDNATHAHAQTTSSLWHDGYPSGGNYWSGHTCTGDPSGGGQPYVINGTNRDEYPFEHPDGWECRECRSGEISSEGGQHEGTLVRKTFRLRQDEYEYPLEATDVHVKFWQEECNIDINGWRIFTTDFSSAHSEYAPVPGGAEPDTLHAVDFDAWDGSVAFMDSITTRVCFWLTEYNTIRNDDLDWSRNGDSRQAVPDYGWKIYWPQHVADMQYAHYFTLTNDDPSLPLRVESCSLSVLQDFVSDLDTIVFDTVVPGLPRVLNPGNRIEFVAQTYGRFVGGHIYGKFRLKDEAGIDYNVLEIFDHPVTAKPVGVGMRESQMPSPYHLEQNYPNPFNPVTTIAYRVPPPGAEISIRIYDVSGRMVAELLRRHVSPGYHTIRWDGTDDSGKTAASGVYFVRLAAPGFDATRKLLLLK